MRIAILCLEKGGGIAHCAYELAKAMADRAEVSCYLAAQNDMLDRFRTLPCQLRVFPLSRGPRSLLLAMVTGRERSGVASAIEADSPDILLDAGSGAWASVVLRRLKGRLPIAQIVHDVYPHPDFRSRLDALPGLLQPTVADALIGLSDFSHAQLERKYPHKPCIRSRLGALMSPGEISTTSIAERRHKQLFTGRIFPYKGVTTLVEAFSLARQSNAALELDIVGRGRIGARLLRRIHDLGIGLDNRYISDAEMKDVIASHGVMILPYTSATQSAVAALALANGMPCIATNVGALPEHVIHGRNGLLVPPRDPDALARAMVAISTDAEMAARMATEALRVGQEVYSWSTIGAALLDDLSRFLESTRSSSGGT